MEYLSLIVCLVGLVIYIFSRPEQSRFTETGRILFWVGLLVFLLKDAPQVVNLFYRYR